MGIDDHWHADVGSTGLLNFGLTLGTPVLRPSRGSNDRQLGMPIARPVLTRSRGNGPERLSFSGPAVADDGVAGA